MAVSQGYFSNYLLKAVSVIKKQSKLSSQIIQCRNRNDYMIY